MADRKLLAFFDVFRGGKVRGAVRPVPSATGAVCGSCGAALFGTARRRYCSDACRVRAWRGVRLGSGSEADERSLLRRLLAKYPDENGKA